MCQCPGVASARSLHAALQVSGARRTVNGPFWRICLVGGWNACGMCMWRAWFVLVSGGGISNIAACSIKGEHWAFTTVIL